MGDIKKGFLMSIGAQLGIVAFHMMSRYINERYGEEKPEEKTE